VSSLPIDPNFQKNRKKLGKEKGVTMWGPVDPPEKLGVRGSNVAVDWDLCIGCGVCLEVCPAQVYEWRETAGHPASEKKPFPAKATKCMCCYQCEKQCPVQAIRVIFGGPQSPVDMLVSYLMLVHLIGGPLYGLVFGPYLHLTIPFYIGWIVLAASLPFFFSPVLYFKTRGKPTDGKGIMDTTVIVESGTYGIVRHPQLLGSICIVCASILISQHWVFALIGILIVGVTPKWIREAEVSLVAKFGDDYRRYMRRVPKMNLFLGILRVVQRRREN
jgi:protein-S-isoprenylcysteine O-methyltransferase Ste14/NAD-dependent dihydropyrimidine dehydrogenase PreA subunit